MTEEIKESIKELEILITALDGTERGEEHNAYTVKCIKNVIDCITNLQQDLEKANDIIEKDRQLYKCRMDEYVELKKENEELNRTCELYSKSLYNAELTDYKSRCEKANKIITDFMCTDEYCSVDSVAIAENYMEIQKALNGSDENETKKS